MTNPSRSAETFSAEELAAARRLRRSVWPDPETRRKLNRDDQCPHQPMCLSVQVCIEEIAWWLRHRAEFAALEDARESA